MSTSPEDYFVWDGKQISTHGDVAKAMLEIVRLSKSLGDIGLMPMEFLDAYGGWLDDHLEDPEDDGRTVARDNLGYLAGYETPEDRAMIFKLFECSHPVLGDKNPTPQEAFEAGQRWAESWKKESHAA